MIQIGTTLNVIDNSGAKKAYCIKIIQGYKKRYARLGEIILVVIKTLRKRRRLLSKLSINNVKLYFEKKKSQFKNSSFVRITAKKRNLFKSVYTNP